MIKTGILPLVMLAALARAEKWEAVPLGPDVPPLKHQRPPVINEIKPRLQRIAVDGPPIVLIKDGMPRFKMVVADTPTKSAEQACLFFRNAIWRLLGEDVQVLRESQIRFERSKDGLVIVSGTETLPAAFVFGRSTLGAEIGMGVDDLPEEGYRIKSVGNVIFIAGRDNQKADLTVHGTLWGAVAFLERHMGFRWLWPGDLGEERPNLSYFETKPLNEIDSPAIANREIRNWAFKTVAFGGAEQRHADHTNEPLAESAPSERVGDIGKLNRFYHNGFKALRIDANAPALRMLPGSAWELYNRLGRSFYIKGGHSYEGLWDKYGRDHPEYFALQPNGTRTQTSSREVLNVANRDIAGIIAKDRIRGFHENPQYQAYSIWPNDGSGENFFGMGQEERKLDPPNAPKIELLFRIDGKVQYIPYPSLSDRYLSFYNLIAESVMKQHPDKLLYAGAYSAYRTAPLYTPVHPNLLITFTGMDYYNESMRAFDLRNWDGWAMKAKQMALWSNHFHGSGGKGFLNVCVRRLSADIRHMFESANLIGMNWHANMNSWSTDGLNYYALARFMWDPSLDPDAVMDDYCRSGFGPAAPAIKEYFGQLQAMTDRFAALSSNERLDRAIRDEEDDRGILIPHWQNRAAMKRAEEAFLPVYNRESLSRLQGILDRALQTDGITDRIRKRILFLTIGLRHMTYHTEYTALESQGRPATDPQTRRVLNEWHGFLMDVLKNHSYALNVPMIGHALLLNIRGFKPESAP